jgi:glycosyltransferase involved in cell wall biosynthesis
VDFDLVHHVTFVNDWTPSAGAFFDVPFVLGPVGRHPALPLNYLLSLRSKLPLLSEVTRSAIRSIASACDPLTHATHRRAAKIMVIEPALIKRRFRQKTSVLPAISLDLSAIPQVVSSPNAAMKLYWTGNFIYWKGPELAIEAFVIAKRSCPGLELHMYGDGPLRSSLMARHADQAGLYFHGRMTQAALFEAEAQMDIFLYPSFEGGGMVVLEAMALGKPVIGIAYGGLNQMITEDCGRLVPYIAFGQVVSELALSIRELAGAPELAKSLGLAGRERVARHFSIESKCDFIERHVYELRES